MIEETLQLTKEELNDLLINSIVNKLNINT